ncbi:MAG: 50S ribosomal protein L24 [Deltaproteobacteria bacterium]|nr:50S ribosomal protein L24 [Deltaproteobacteria bacterium]
MARIKKNDQVKIISGKDKGKTGKILRVLADQDRVVVEKLNLVKKHLKPTQQNPQGGIIEKEMGIHISNVMLLDPKSGEITRVGYREGKKGKKERYAKKSGERISA